MVKVNINWGYVMVVIGFGLSFGGGIFFQQGCFHKKPEPPPVVVVKEEGIKGQIEVQKQLTDFDILTTPCSKEFIDQHGSLLCRELYCRMQQRGIDSKTDSKDCHDIGNVFNTLELFKVCSDKPTEDEKVKCKSDVMDILLKTKG